MTIAVAGGYGVGMTMKVASAPRPGETVTGGELTIGHGGKGSNQAVAASRLGSDVCLFSAIGADNQGVDAREFWSTEHIDDSAVVELHAATMCGFIIVEESGENRIAIAPGALAELTPTHAEAFRHGISRSELLIVSLEIPLAVAIALLRIAKEENTRTLLNPAPATPIPSGVWPLVDYVTPNETEAATILGDEGMGCAPEDMAAKLHQRSGAVVVVTAGERGVAVHGPREVFMIKALSVGSVRDTTGAGDAFTAAFGVALTQGVPLRDAIEFAGAAGAYAVTVDGAIGAFATRAVLEKFIAEVSAKQRGTS